MRHLTLGLTLTLVLSLSACQSTPGPLQPAVGPKAPGVLVIVPSLVPYLDVPNGEQNYSFRNDLLEYNTVVRNKGGRAMNLQYTAFFQNEAGQLVEEQSPLTFFIDASSEVPLRVSANNKEAKTMRLQIRPAK